MRKRALSLILALTLAAGLLPVQRAEAADSDATDLEEEITQAMEEQRAEVLEATADAEEVALDEEMVYEICDLSDDSWLDGMALASVGEDEDEDEDEEVQNGERWCDDATSYRTQLYLSNEEDGVTDSFDSYTYYTIDLAMRATYGNDEEAEDTGASVELGYVSVDDGTGVTETMLCRVIQDIGFIYTCPMDDHVVINEEGQYTIEKKYLYKQLERMYSQMERGAYAYVYDNPSVFWIRTNFVRGITGDWSYSPEKNEIYITAFLAFVAFPATDTEEKVYALEGKLLPVVQDLLDKTEDMSDVAKLAYFDNWLAEHNVYNSKAAEDDDYLSQDETPWSIVSGLLDKYSPVCEGYAKAFQLLCKLSGIPCVTISGKAYDDGVPGDHMWTAVKLDGKWYVVDPTWDDPLYEDEGKDPGGNTTSTGEYFLVKQPETHIVEMSLPTPSISETNYLKASSDGNNAGESVSEGTISQNWTMNTESEKVSISGVEVVEDTYASQRYYLMVLYDDHYRMIACGYCVESTWVNGQTAFSAPDFDESDLEQAAKIVRICVSKDSWAPVDAGLLIFGGSSQQGTQGTG